MIYKDSSKPLQDRIRDLIERMTLKEKVAQLSCWVTMGNSQMINNLEEHLKEGIGTLSYLNSSLTGDNAKDMETLKKIQRYLVEETRLGIPALVHSEGIAGAQIPKATTFPQSINVASTWDPSLAERIGEVVKKQLMAFGIKAAHSPLFDLGRDPRWGRIGETYGEDPYVVAQMGTAFVKGLQGDNEVMGTAKHFVGYGNAEGGRNGAEQQIGDRKLLDTYCLPFEAAIYEANVMGIMNSYGILNEQAVSTSKWLLTDILRDKLGFSGVVVSDYGSISHAHARYRVASNQKETAIMALRAGMDVEQPTNTCYKHLVEAVELGELEEEAIDCSVRRILEIKFKLGLFENPYEEGNFDEEINNHTYTKLSQEVAEKSIVMVKNEENILPINKEVSGKKVRIALIGPSAEDKINFFGGYSSVGTASTTSRDFDKSEEDNYIKMAYHAAITEYKDMLKTVGIEFEDQPSPEQKEQIIKMMKQKKGESNKEYQSTQEFIEKYYPHCKSIKQVLEEHFGEENILYARGCEIKQSLSNGIEEVRRVVENADLVIAVLGGKESMRASDATCGENKDNININVEKPQQDMMEEVFKLGKDVVSVIIDGRPLAISSISERSKAVLYGWLPAQEGAQAIVNVITGKCNPSGKLPVTIVKDKGQIPMYNSRLPVFAELEEWAEYIDGDKNKPLYPFGHGLSYTQFEYSDLQMKNHVQVDEKLEVSFTLKNNGSYSGDEIVQVYIRDCVSSVARPVKQLVGFKRVDLEMGQQKQIAFEINMKQLAFHDLEMQQVVEPGKMEIYIGASSEDIRLRGEFDIVGEKMKVERKVFFSKVIVSE
jgi:beta-glucosidase